MKYNSNRNIQIQEIQNPLKRVLKLILFSLTLLIFTGISKAMASSNMGLEYNTNLGEGTTIRLPLNGSVNVTVDWGDGSGYESFTTAGDKIHTYASEGIYTVQISGTLSGFGSENFSPVMLTKVLSWGGLGLVNLSNAFFAATNLQVVPADLPATVTSTYGMFWQASSFNQDISSWNTENVTNMSGMFAQATAFNQNIGSWNTENVTNMAGMFSEATSFNQDIGLWNTTKVVDMNSIFSGATSFNQPIGIWNTAKVINMSYMFYKASAFNQDIGGWNTSNVNSMSYMFYEASSFNREISNWNTTKVVDMSGIFSGATSFNHPIGGWNTANVTNMSYMFHRASAFNQDIGTWNTANVTNMGYMFINAVVFNQDIGTWNTANVTNMYAMFYLAKAFNQNIGSWNTSGVTTMYAMFYGATYFNGAISNWNTANVTDMSYMFGMATSFDQNLGNWSVSKVSIMEGMFGNVTLSQSNYDALLLGWAAQTLQNGVTFNAGGSKYTSAASAARQSIIDTYGWTITDSGPEPQAPVVSSVTVPANGSYKTGENLDFTLNFDQAVTVSGTPFLPITLNTGGTVQATYISGSGSTALTFRYTVQTGEKDLDGPTLGSAINLNGGTIRNSSSIDAVLTLNSVASTTGILIDPQSPMILEYNTNLGFGTTIRFNLSGSVTVTVDWGDGSAPESFTTVGSKSHTYASEGTYTVQISGTLSGIHSSYVSMLTKVLSWGDLGLVNLSHAFSAATNLQVVPADLPATVTSTASMFDGASSFNQDISTWNTENVTDMSFMFYGASAFNQPVGNWNVANVTNMRAMFFGVSSFNQDISNWNTANVTNMSVMFSGASAFNQNISSWNTANVIDLSGIFRGVSSFNQPISSWNTDKVTDMAMMFENATSFNQDISNWNTENVSNMAIMFQGATSFNQDIGNWNTAKVANMNNMFLGASAFNQDIGLWNTSNVTHMNNMFNGATSFNQNIGSWDIAKVIEMGNMFDGIALSKDNYDALLLGWAAQNLQSGVNFNGGASKYTLAAAAPRQSIIDTYGWTITDGGLEPQNPVVSSVSVPANGKYKIGQSLDFTVYFDQNVIVNVAGGRPSISITLNTGGTVQANYQAGSGTTALTFRYTVQAGEQDLDGLTLGTAINLNGGTIQNTNTTNAVLDLNSVQSTTGLLVSGIPEIIYVNQNQASGNNNGISWANAYRNLQSALQRAQSGDQIWVAKGTYSSSSTNSIWDRFTIPTGVKLMGGFNGTENASSQSNPQVNQTILSGELGSPTNPEDNAFYLIVSNEPNTDNLIDGFTITDAQSGLLVAGEINTYLTINRCVFQNHYYWGVVNQASSPVERKIFINNSVFSNNLMAFFNSAQLDGSSYSQLTNCIFYGNSSAVYGAAVLNQAYGSGQFAGTKMINCTVVNHPKSSPAIMNVVYGDQNGTLEQINTLSRNNGSNNPGPDPLFVDITDPDGPDNIWMTADDGLRLQDCSPAINAGSNTDAPESDILGNPIGYTIKDLGAYESTSEGLPQVSAIAGAAILFVNQPLQLTNSTNNGAWLSTNTDVATISSAGLVQALGAGTTTIQYAVTNSSGCTTTVQTSIRVKAIPVLESGEVCSTTTLNISGNTNDIDHVSVYKNNVFTNTLYNTGPGTTVDQFSVSGAGTFKVEVFYADGSTYTTNSISVNPVSPSISYVLTNLNVVKNIAINPMIPQVSTGSSANITYSISPALPTELVFDSQTATISGTLTATRSGSTLYTITASNCVGESSTQLTLNYIAAPTNIILSKANIFEANSQGANIGNLSSTDADANDSHTYTLVSGDVSAFSITGNQLKANAVYNYTSKNSYSVKIRTTDASGLYYEKDFSISISQTPQISGTGNKSGSTISSPPNSNPSISKGYSSQLQVSGSNLVSYSWSPVTGLSNTNTANPVATPSQTTTYSVTVTNSFGSSTSVNITVSVVTDYNITAYNLLTPNGDGENDTWIITNIAAYPNNQVKLFDRTGRLVYNKTGYTNDWDAQVDGSVLPNGAYYYIINLGEGIPIRKGSLTIIR